LRILIDGRYVQDRFPGIGRYGWSLIRALAARADNEDLLAVVASTRACRRHDLVALRNAPAIRLFPTAAAPFSPRAQWHLPAIARRLAPDVFHAMHPVKPVFMPCPSVVTVYDLIPLLCPSSMPALGKRLLFHLAVWLACRTSEVILTPSESSRRDLGRFFPISRGKTRVTPLGMDDAFHPCPPAEIERVRRRYELPPRYVLSFASDRPHKNVGRLLEAWARASTMRGACDTPDSPLLVLVGQGQAVQSRARDQAQALGIGETILFRGQVAEYDLPAVYSGASLFVSASLYEGFGLPVLEGMACGVPVVCSNTSSLPEVAGDATLLVNPLSVPDLAEAIERVLLDDQLCDDLRARGLARAKKFSWGQTAAATYRAYEAARGRSNMAEPIGPGLAS
jgi:glycosyltransferase involved in cell wall biosynthesis